MAMDRTTNTINRASKRGEKPGNYFFVSDVISFFPLLESLLMLTGDGGLGYNGLALDGQIEMKRHETQMKLGESGLLKWQRNSLSTAVCMHYTIRIKGP